MTSRTTIRIMAVFMAAMVFANGTLATAAVCQSLCAPAAQPMRAIHHGGMGHMHPSAAGEFVLAAGMSGPQCSTQVEARLERRTVTGPQTRQVATVALAALSVSQFASTAPGEHGAVTSSPPDPKIPSRAIPLRV